MIVRIFFGKIKWSTLSFVIKFRFHFNCGFSSTVRNHIYHLNNYLQMLKILCTYKWIPHAKQVLMHLCHTHSLFAWVSLVIYISYQFLQQFFRLSFQAIHGTVLYWMALFIHLCKQIVSIIIFLIDKSLHFQTQSTYRNTSFIFFLLPIVYWDSEEKVLHSFSRQLYSCSFPMQILYKYACVRVCVCLLACQKFLTYL